MARLWSSGFELNTISTSVEGYTIFQSNPTISSSTVRSGAYSLNPATSVNREGIIYQYSNNTEGSYFFRFFIRIADDLDGQQEIIRLRDTSGNGKVSIRLNTDETLELWNEEDAAQVGSDSSSLSLNTWYRIELAVDSTTLASTAIEAKIDEVTFASGTINITESPGQMLLGCGLTSNVSGDLFFDDVAINDSSGSFENSYPGSGKIIHLRPNAAGDNSDWTNDYTYVDEVTPDDATTLVSSNTLDQIDDHNIEAPSAIGDSDTINVVQVGVRFNGVGASANASFVLRVKASSGGTVEESAAITPSNATWVTNAAAAPRNYSLTLYDLPGASTTPWTKEDLASAQIGVRLSATSTNAAQVSTLWLLVDSVPVITKKWGVKPR